MNNASGAPATRVTIKPGLIEKLQERSGIRNEAAFARLLNADQAEVMRLRQGGEVSIRGVVGIASAFGMSLRDVVTAEVPKAAAA